MADIQGSPLDFEIQRLAQRTVKKASSITAIVLAGGVEIYPLKVVRMDVHSNYEASYRDESSIAMMFGLGTLMYDIAPYQDDLKILITEDKWTGNTYVPHTTSYRAHLLQDVDTPISGSNTAYMGEKEAANKAEMLLVSFSISLLSLEYLENASLGTNIRSSPPYVVLKTLFADAIDSVNIDDENRITGIDMYEPSNTLPRNQMVIPDNTRLVDLPDLIQNNLGGIYSSGLGFYIQDTTVYFWPTYDTVRTGENSRKLQIILAPTNHYKAFENTYLTENDIVTILGTGPVDVEDDTLGDLNKTGNSVRFLDAIKAIDGFGKVEGNRFIANRGEANSELSIVPVGSGLNMVRQSVAKVTSNIYRETSKLAAKAGKKLTLLWRWSDPQLLIPGMPVTIFYGLDGITREAKGILLSCTSATEMVGYGMAPGNVITNSALSIFIDRNDPIFSQYTSMGGRPTVLETT